MPSHKPSDNHLPLGRTSIFVAVASLHSQRFSRLLLIFAFLLPITLFPERLFDHSAVYIPQPELIHGWPRLCLLGIVALAGWRFWRFDNVFAHLLLGYLGLVVLGALNARDPDGLLYALIGPWSRMDGVYYQVAVVLLSIATFQVFKLHPWLTHTLLQVILLSGVIQATLIGLQRYKLDFWGPLVSGQYANSPMGTLGHPGVAAGLLVVAVLIGIGLLMTQPRPRFSWLLVCGTLMCATALGFTDNRTGILATLLVLMLRTIFQFSWPGLLYSLIIIIAIFLPQRLLVNPQGFERAIENTNTLEARLTTWKLATRITQYIPGFPILGGGPDALMFGLVNHVPFDALFPLYRLDLSLPQNASIADWKIVDSYGTGKFRDQDYEVLFKQFGEKQNVTYRYTVLFLNKAHNTVLDRLLTTGIIGALIWLALYMFPALVLFKQRSAQGMLLVWLLLALLIYHMTWFPVIQLEPIHMLILAAAWSLVITSPPAKPIAKPH